MDVLLCAYLDSGLGEGRLDLIQVVHVHKLRLPPELDDRARHLCPGECTGSEVFVEKGAEEINGSREIWARIAGPNPSHGLSVGERLRECTCLLDGSAVKVLGAHDGISRRHDSVQSHDLMRSVSPGQGAASA